MSLQAGVAFILILSAFSALGIYHIGNELDKIYRRLGIMMSPEHREAELAAILAELTAKEKRRKRAAIVGIPILAGLAALVIGAYIAASVLGW